MRILALLAFALGGCTSAWDVSVPAAPPDRPAAFAPQVELVFQREGEHVRGLPAWRDTIHQELRALGPADVAVLGSTTVLELQVDRELSSGVPTLVLHLLTAFLWPHSQDLKLAVRGALRVDGTVVASASSEAELVLRTSSAFLVWPAAWRSTGDGKLELPEVLDALRVCFRRVATELSAARGQPPPITTEPEPPTVAPPRACPSCARGAEPEWVACPFCGTALPTKQ